MEKNININDTKVEDTKNSELETLKEQMKTVMAENKAFKSIIETLKNKPEPTPTPVEPKEVLEELPKTAEITDDHGNTDLEKLKETAIEEIKKELKGSVI